MDEARISAQPVMFSLKFHGTFFWPQDYKTKRENPILIFLTSLISPLSFNISKRKGLNLSNHLSP